MCHFLLTVDKLSLSLELQQSLYFPQSVAVLLVCILYYGWPEHDLHSYPSHVLNLVWQLSSMALTGYCIHLCVAVIICILVLIRIYLDRLEMVDSNDSGSLFNDRKYIP